MRDDFAEIAAYYDDLYVKPAQYRREAAKVISLIETYRLSGGKTLLDIACGTGGHMPYWRERFLATGLDLSREMLSHAVRKFPGIEFHQGNMIDFIIDRKFDALVCLYGSIGFVRTLENLKKALENFSAHMKDGAVFCLTPWSTTEEFKPRIVVDSVKHSHVNIARLENVRLKAPGLIEVDFHHLIGRDSVVTYHQYSMEIGLFSRNHYTDAIAEAGLELLDYYQGEDVPMGIFTARKK